MCNLYNVEAWNRNDRVAVVVVKLVQASEELRQQIYTGYDLGSSITVLNAIQKASFDGF